MFLGTRYELSVSAMTRSELFGSPSGSFSVDSMPGPPHKPNLLKVKVNEKQYKSSF